MSRVWSRIATPNQPGSQGLSMINATGDQYTANILAEDAVAPGREYYLEASDAAGNIAQAVSPVATTATKWTQWSIPLADLSAAGVDVTAVAKIYLGVVDRDNPTAGGSGRLFIDDILVNGTVAAAAGQ